MKKRILLIALFLIIINRPCFADFKFAVISDTQDTDEDGINNGVFAAIMDKIKSEGVDFIMVTGDMISGTTRTSDHMKQLRNWKDIMAGYKVPYYCTPSNHLIQSESSENVFRSIFEMPQNGPARFRELVYSFNHKKVHFIGLDTDEYNNFHQIGEKQFIWLKRDLKKNRKKVIFIFGHDPAYPVSHHKNNSLDKFPDKRDELWSLFKECGVKVYFCGHEHLYNKSLHDGVYQVIAGGAGGVPCEPPEKGGFHHFVVVDVKDDGSCEVTVKDIDGVIKDTFSIPQ